MGSLPAQQCAQRRLHGANKVVVGQGAGLAVPVVHIESQVLLYLKAVLHRDLHWTRRGDVRCRYRCRSRVGVVAMCWCLAVVLCVCGVGGGAAVVALVPCDKVVSGKRAAMPYRGGEGRAWGVKYRLRAAHLPEAGLGGT